MIRYQLLTDSAENFGTHTEKDSEMYFAYKSELWDILGCDPYPENIVYSWYYDLLMAKTFHIKIFDDDTLIGFIFIAVGDDCPKQFDFYIWDCYIKPEYRGNRIVSDYMHDFISDHLGKYCFFLIDENVSARNMWTNIFNSLGYSEFQFEKSDDILLMETEKTHFHGYKYL